MVNLTDVFQAEVLAARLEGALRADTDLAMIWRAEAAVQEACASAWLEDLPLQPQTLLIRAFQTAVGDPDQDRAAQSGAAVLRGLHSPGDLLRDTKVVMARIWSLSAHDGAGRCPFTPDDDMRIVSALRNAASPILGAIEIAKLVNELTDAQAPSAERLSFVAADHALRGSGRFMMGEAHAPHTLIAAPRGAWVLQPSVAVVENGFRLWSITRPDALGHLVTGMTRSLERAIGSLALHRKFLHKLRRLDAEAHGASKTPDLLRLLLAQPIVSTGEVAAKLKLSSRGALKIIDRAVTDGILVKIVGRQTYRAWATAPFARILGGNTC